MVISPPNARGPAVSPDGRWIYYSRGSTDLSDIWRSPAESEGPETLVVQNAMDRSYVPVQDGIWFLRRMQERVRTALVYHDLRTGKERIASQLGERVQPGLTISPRKNLPSAIFTRADEGTRDLMIVEGFRSR
jgi:hypothetical protein